jgi:chemotaxis protein CheD
MAAVVVGIADCKVSRQPDDFLVTHALGSCIAILAYDPVAKVAGLLHYMLPESSMDAAQADSRPFMFADTGIPLLLQAVCQLGAVKTRLVVMAAGGAQMMDPNGTFNIGQRNHVAMRKVLWKAGVLLQQEAIGGTVPRTVRIDVGSGRVQLKMPGAQDQDLVVNVKKNGASDGLQHPHRR